MDSYTLCVWQVGHLDIFYSRTVAKLKVCIDESIVKIEIDQIIKSWSV